MVVLKMNVHKRSFALHTHVPSVHIIKGFEITCLALHSRTLKPFKNFTKLQESVSFNLILKVGLASDNMQHTLYMQESVSFNLILK